MLLLVTEEYVRVSGDFTCICGIGMKTRAPRTVRNIAKHLPEALKLAKRKHLLPANFVLPTNGDDYKRTIARLTKAPIDGPSSLPASSFAKLISCESIPFNRRVGYMVDGYTGVRPGERQGMKIESVVKEDGVTLIRITEQFQLPRTGVKARQGKTKTDRGVRDIPVHRALLPELEAWIATGWKDFVGRDPEPTDYLFPDASGKPFRDERADQFQADRVTSDCPTTHKGKKHTYPLRRPRRDGSFAILDIRAR